ncbi:MAG: sortase [Candidatus Gracilibacteria bacterium]|nr:sortase [Candidatus Gracilibacteria bacterium]
MKDSNLENFDILDNIDLSATYSENQEKTSLDETYLTQQNIELNSNNVQTLDISSITLTETNLEDELSKEIEAIKSDEVVNIIENSNIKKIVKKNNSIVSGFLFLSKYALTSSLIFGVLLISTNYSAYFNIAKSYIFKSELESRENKLISSVEAASIKEKYAEEKIKELEKKDDLDSEHSIRKMKKTQDKENINLNIDITPYENRLVIPKIGKNVPLVDIKNRTVEGQKELHGIFMKELEKGIIRYPGSAKPGQIGNSFIFGHSSNFPWAKGEYNEVFALLDKVTYDDEIVVYYGQEKYTYKITQKKVITPGDVSVLDKKSDKKEITLMTCWPIGTTLNRLIVTGELVKK